MLLDAIPLSEVTSVELMVSANSGDQQDLPTNSYDSVIDFTHAFQIRTVKNGQNAGRKYILRASSDEEVGSLIEQFNELAKKAFHAQKDSVKSWRQKVQKHVRKLYSASWFQAVTATLIIAVSSLILLKLSISKCLTFTSMQNFCVSAAEVQVQRETLYEPDGSPTSTKQMMELLNTVFTALFTVELLFNFLSQSVREFVSNAWSIFDTIVVTMSLIVLGPLDFPISILRALRVVLLFGRLESSKKILAALSVSLIPMCNAFFIMLIVAMICEPLAFETHNASSCHFPRQQHTKSVKIMRILSQPLPHSRSEKNKV